MQLASKVRTPIRESSGPMPWAAAWEWLVRPNHYRAVHALRIAAERGDAPRLASLLDPAVAVVVDSGDTEHPTIRVINGVHDAIALLLHGMSPRPGRGITERSVNGQAGLILNSDNTAEAAVTLDFTGRLVSVMWIRLQPRIQRHWNAV
jgi:hypothetical protein